jgi:hypothetical protein
MLDFSRERMKINDDSTKPSISRLFVEYEGGLSVHYSPITNTTAHSEE